MTDPHVDCWHFAAATLRDGRPLPVKGQTLVHDGPVVLCKSGFHGSVLALDALSYAPGWNVARVRLSGELLNGGDKFVARARMNLTDYVDASRVLHEFACWCADRIINAEALWPVSLIGREAVRLRRARLDKLKHGEDIADEAWETARTARCATASDSAMTAEMDTQQSELSRALYALLGVQP